ILYPNHGMKIADIHWGSPCGNAGRRQIGTSGGGWQMVRECAMPVARLVSEWHKMMCQNKGPTTMNTPVTPDQQAEIDNLRESPRQTLRVISDGMERHLYTAHPVLDHGFVRVVDYMGDDAAICQAARVSYGRGTKSVQNDEGLIR